MYTHISHIRYTVYVKNKIYKYIYLHIVHMYTYIHIYIYIQTIIQIYSLKIKQTPLSLKLEPQIWVLEWFLITKTKAFDIPEREAE